MKACCAVENDRVRERAGIPRRCGVPVELLLPPLGSTAVMDDGAGLTDWDARWPRRRPIDGELDDALDLLLPLSDETRLIDLVAR